MDDVLLARSLFGTTMGFHIIFATIGVGLPLMILVAEIMYQRTKDLDYVVMAKRWTKAFAVLLGVGIPSGTIAGVQLSLLWPGFMEVIGRVMALPFQIEIYAFFIEALFMSIYVYAADRISPWMRIVSLLSVAIGAVFSAVLITNVHAFEGTPAGFSIRNGQIIDVDPWAAFFNPSFVTTAIHVVFSAYMTGAFVIASVAAFKLLKAKNVETRIIQFHQKALMLCVIIGGIFSLLTALNGHESAQLLHKHQPEKLAAAEGLFETQTHAPLAIGGYTDQASQSVKWAIEIPWALSFLAGNSFDTKVIGLNDFPKKYWPPLFIHTLFNGMVGIGTLLILISIFAFVWKKTLKKKFPKWLMCFFVLSGPLSILGIEFGWVFACTGRQPWTIYRILSTEDSATTAGNLGFLFILFTAMYIFLGLAVILVLRYYFRKHTVLDDLNRANKNQPSSLGSTI